MLLRDIVKVRQTGAPIPKKILSALPQLQRTFPKFIPPDENVVPADQVFDAVLEPSLEGSVVCHTAFLCFFCNDVEALLRGTNV